MNSLTEIRWHGRGGQGAKTAALLLADVAFQLGKHVQGFPEYGPERMGAPITAYDRISDGQKQRVLIARALCQKPGLLIMDEPASFLDIRYQLELMEILRDLTKMGISVVISMHELMLAKNSADSIICIYDGGISSHDDVKGFFEGDEIYKVFGISKGSIGFL